MAGFAITPTLRRHDALGLIASHKNLIVSMHWGRPGLEHADALAQYTAEVVSAHERFASVVIVTSDDLLHVPTAEARERLRQLVEDTATTGLATAFIVSRGGFLGGAVVALLSGLFVLSRSPVPNRAFRTIGPAVSWLQEHVADGPTPWQAGELLEALEAIEALASNATR